MKLGLNVSYAITSLRVSNQICGEVTLSLYCRDVMVSLGDRIFACDLHMFDYLFFGLILGMDWLSLYDTHIYTVQTGLSH